MEDIDTAIEHGMESVCTKSYLLMIFLYAFVIHAYVPQIMMILFAAPPVDAFYYNPHADNSTETVVSEWNLTGDQVNWIPGLLQSIHFFGFMVGAVLFGQLSDRYGRNSVGWKVHTLMLIFSFGIVFSQNWRQMAVFRFGSGLGTGGLGVVNAVLVQESSPARLWLVNGAYTGTVFTISMMVFLLCGYYFPSWRALAIISMIPSIAGYLFYCIIPESPRWLHTHGKFAEAEKSIQFYAKCNGRKSSHIYRPLVNGSVQSRAEAIEPSTFNSKYSIIDLVRIPILRPRTIILSFEWFTTNFVYYCITLGAGSFSPNFYLAFAISALSQLPSIPICLYFMSRSWCGRRRCLAGLMVLTSVSLFAIYISSNVKENGLWRLILFVTAKVGSSGCFNLVSIYTPELYPTVVRNVGLGSMSTIARIGAMSAPFLATWTVNTGLDTPFLFHGILCGLASVSALFLPETRGKKITNTIEDCYLQDWE